MTNRGDRHCNAHTPNTHCEASELIFETEHPVAGTIRQPRAAALFPETPTTLRRPAPTLGEHTDEILSELGLSN